MSLGDASLLFAVVASVIGGVVVLAGMKRWRRRRDAGLVRAAATLGGRVSDSTGLERRSIQFQIENRPALIEYESGEESFTRVRVAMSRRSPGVLRILARGRVSMVSRLVGLPDLRIGDRKFDHEWYISARPESVLRRVFSEERREQVMHSVRRIARFSGPSIEITRDMLGIRVDGLLDREADLLDLAKTATDFVGYLLRLAPEDGIAWVGSGDSDPGLCPVCAAAMTEQVVVCEKCTTPHHEECWRYVGQCSTYACYGKRFSPGPVSRS